MEYCRVFFVALCIAMCTVANSQPDKILSECQRYGKTFQKDEHHYIWVTPDDMVGGVGGSISNPDQCKELCLAETKFECRLVEYYSPNRICVLFSMNTLKSSSALNYRPSVSYDIYLRDCATSDAASEAVVFSVELSTSLPHMTQPTKVVFDHVTTNGGNGYDATSGIFTAPTAGYYSISASLISWHNSRFFVMLNDKSVEYLASLGHWMADSATVNLKLAEGDRVWIEAIGVIYGFTTCGYTSLFGDKYKCFHSSFSGLLIK